VTNYPDLQPESFPAFFHTLYRRAPFRWQARLAERACHGDWPQFIKLPTASGKTSCLDIAVFALAHQAWRRYASGTEIDAPRRIYFVVDRRIIVNEAFNRANALKKQLKEATDKPNSPLFPVAYWLRLLADNKYAPPLDCFELRGGIYRDDAWVRSMLQPTIVASTVDQIGSRLLFRGYGVSDCSLPIHAALTANDSLILLDEAHCSKPFSQTMDAIARYRDAYLEPNETPRWAEQLIYTPFRFVEMTATPRDASGKGTFQLEEADYQVDQALDERHGCAKAIRLEASNAKGGKQNAQLARDLAAQAESLAKGSDSQPPCLRIAIVVNRVECARRAFDLLKDKHGDRVELMIGRMRPFDRDRLTKTLQARFQCESQEQLTEPHFVVATQCLEVGADFDFDGMVCQCASLDSLRQRFGRLNRLGKSPHARGVIVMAEGDRAPRKPDPIYGESLPAAWEWLEQHATDKMLDFGIRSLDSMLAEARRNDADAVAKLIAPSLDAPVLMPAHLDLLCQTAPRPAVEPEVAPYLHGPNRGVPEVCICWRADLPDDRDCQHWLEECRQTLAVCPPSSAECLSVPLPQFKAWLQGKDGETADDSGDVIGEATGDDSDFEAGPSKSKSKPLPHRRGVVWKGRECRAISGSDDEVESLYPNAVVVLPATAGGWTKLGYVPNAPQESVARPNSARSEPPSAEERRNVARIDVASAAFEQARDRLILRVHENLMTAAADRQSLAGLWDFVGDLNSVWHHRELLTPVNDGPASVEPTEDSATQELPPGRSQELRLVRETLADKPAKQVTMLRYPGGFAVIGPRMSPRPELPRASFDDEFDEHNLDADERLSLANHLADVTAETKRSVENVGLELPLAAALIAAAGRHDLGKADPRFQAMLLGSSLDMAYMQPRLWAKSARGAASAPANSPSRPAADGLPTGFRHEMLSLDFARQLRHDLDGVAADVMLHAIAAHHGHARPFAPVVIDEDPPTASLERLFPPDASASTLALSPEQRLRLPAHRLDSGISDRFWRLTRRFGWWGVAWLESALRLADWVASAQPRKNGDAIVLRAAPQVATQPTEHLLPLPGLNGANPLAFLAALGVLRTLTVAMPDIVARMKWKMDGVWHPVLVTDHILSPQQLVSSLQAALENRQGEAHFLKLGKNINVPRIIFRQCLLDAVGSSDQRQRTSADYFAAFGSDALVSLNDGVTIQDTALRTMAGAGHQHFLETMRNLIEQCRAEHLEKALFRTWDYSDPTQTLSLRFDPLDDNRYALRWRNPSGDPDRKSSGSMLGANRLAIEAIPVLPTAAGAKRLQTTAFSGFRSDDTFFHWPLWEAPLGLSVVQSLMMSRELISQSVIRANLLPRGVRAAMKSQRITVGKVLPFQIRPVCRTTIRRHACHEKQKQNPAPGNGRMDWTPRRWERRWRTRRWMPTTSTNSIRDC
jgi:CRISPR-associated endonuclease/helicase Cas3